MTIVDIVGAVAILLAIGTVIANLILGAQYDLDNRKHPAAKMPKQTSNSNRTTKCQ